jgi:hypothetical protein
MIRTALPDAWLSELGEAVPEPGRTLAISLRPGFDEQLPSGITRERLARDLSQGVRIRRANLPKGERYTLLGSEFALHVYPHAGRTTGRTLAVGARVERRVELGTTQPGAPLLISFHDIWEEVAGDVAGLELAESTWHAAQKRGRKLLAPPLSLADRFRRHARLQYLLLDLQDLRFRLTPRVALPGRVVADPSAGPGLLAVELAQGNVREGAKVSLRGVGEALTSRVEWVEETRIHLRMPPGPLPGAGEGVTVTIEEPFPFEAQRRALRRLVNLELIGDPEDLAQLLLRPASLRPAAPRAAPVFFHGQLDAQQRAAVTTAVHAPVAAFVHGPPGTGKSTVIVEAIRQLTARGERVLFASPSHVAVDEVLRRLRDTPGVRPLRLSWAAGLVLEEVRCFTPEALTQSAARALLANAGGGALDEERRSAMRTHKTLQAARGRLPAIAAARAAVRASVAERESASALYLTAMQAWRHGEVPHSAVGAAQRALDRAILLSKGAEAALAALAPPDPKLDAPEALDAAIEETKQRLERLELLVDLQPGWRESLDRLGPGAERAVLRELEDLPPRAANVVACTITGLAGSPWVRDAEFDTLIVDEASRVTEGQVLIGAVRARRWIFVGDEHQLPPHVDPTDEQALHALIALRAVKCGKATSIEAAVAQLAAIWEEEEELRQFRVDAVRREAEAIEQRGEWPQYAEVLDKHDDSDRTLLVALRNLLVRSFFERVVQALSGEAVACAVRLEVQRRMVPAIAHLVAGPIYDGAYRSPAPGADRHRSLPVLPAPVLWLDTSKEGRRAEEAQEGNGFVNKLEAGWIVDLLHSIDADLDRRDHPAVLTSVLCFYRAQANLIRHLLAQGRRLNRLRVGLVDAIDKIQGQESDLVVVSFCRARLGLRGPGYGQWLQDYRRLNVACTRAHGNLVLVGHGSTLRQFTGADRAGRFYANLFACADKPEPWLRTQLDRRATGESG